MITINSILDAEQYFEDMEAVVFDLDDTLYSEKGYVACGFRAVAALFPEMPGMFERLMEIYRGDRPAIDVVLAEHELLARKDEAVAAYRSNIPVLELYPGVRDMLLRLKGSKKLGLITDGRPVAQRGKIKALDLEPLFDEIIVTDEFGGPEFRKPNPLAYSEMAARLRVPYEKMSYTGDNITKDFITPEKLGMRSIWFKNTDGLYYKD